MTTYLALSNNQEVKTEQNFQDFNRKREELSVEVKRILEELSMTFSPEENVKYAIRTSNGEVWADLFRLTPANINEGEWEVINSYKVKIET